MSDIENIDDKLLSVIFNYRVRFISIWWLLFRNIVFIVDVNCKVNCEFCFFLIF